MNPEAVLLVDDDQPEVPEHHVFLEQCVGADDKRDLSRRDARKDLVARLALLAAGEQRDGDATGIAELGKGRMVLAGEDLGWHHQGALRSTLDGRGKRQECHHGLA